MRTSAPRSGFILVTVLSVLAVLAALVSALMLLTRANLAAARQASDRLGDLALIEAAKEIAGYELFVANQPIGSVNGQIVRLDAGDVTIFVDNPAGRIDLNRSDPALLANAYAASGASGLTPGAFASRVIDWRDEDDKPGLNGAEVADYRRLGLGWSPPNHDFLSVEELARLAGVTPDDARRLQPFFTVDNPDGAIDVLAAPQSVLRVIPGLAAASAETIMRLRQDLTEEGRATIAKIIRPCGSLAVAGSDLRIAELRLEIRRGAGGQRTLMVTIGADPTGAHAYRSLGQADAAPVN